MANTLPMVVLNNDQGGRIRINESDLDLFLSRGWRVFPPRPDEVAERMTPAPKSRRSLRSRQGE